MLLMGGDGETSGDERRSGSTFAPGSRDAVYGELGEGSSSMVGAGSPKGKIPENSFESIFGVRLEEFFML
jgi:hypothetical protein